MRGSRRLLPVALIALLGVLSIPGGPPVQADTPAQLEAQRAALLQELAALQPQQAAASQALSAAEAAFTSEAAALTQAQAQLAALNAQLAAIATGISEDQAGEAAARNALATITRATYESAGNDSMAAAVLNAQDFSAAMYNLSGASSASADIIGLETTLTRDEKDLQAKQATLQVDFAHASALENQISQQDNLLMVTVYQRDQVVASLSGPARAIAAQIAQIDNELAGTGLTPSGSCGDNFAFGNCTWYVASRRCIPWGGNADEWYYNAAKYGYLEGSVPQVGAVAVWWPGAGGASYLGHVAYVEVVGPTGSIPAGWFEISEMNWGGGFDRVDYRVVQDDPSVFQGFIYGLPASA